MLKFYNNNKNNKGLTSFSSSKDDVRDVPAVYITANRFTLSSLKRHVSEEKNEIQNGADHGNYFKSKVQKMSFKPTAEGGDRRAKAKIRRQRVPDNWSGIRKRAFT